MDQELNELIVKLKHARSPDDERLFRHTPLKVPPKYGVYLWWPTDENWAHLDDLATADELIPSDRVFRREYYDDDYSLLLYGDQFIRVRPVIWLEIIADGYEIGDTVEVKSQMGKGNPRIAQITDIRWDNNTKTLKYSLASKGRVSQRAFAAGEFQLACKLDAFLDERKLRLLQKSRWS